MDERKTLEELLTMTRAEQNAYLETLPEQEMDEMVHAIFHAEADKLVKQMVDSLNSHAKPKDQQP